MQGTSLTKQERECKLYVKFDKFSYKKGESLRDFYLRFSLPLNDMNIYNMKLEQFQVNTKFLNTLPPEWSKFVTDVKLVRDLHTTNVDQLHAYLGQHEYHANEGRQNSLAAGTSRPYTSGPIGNNSGKQRIVVCYNFKGEGHMSKQCTKPKRKRDEAWFKDKLLLIALMVNLSHYGYDNLAENLDFPTQQDALILSVIEQLKTQVVNCTKINQDNKSVNEILTAELERYKDQKEESRNIDRELALEKQTSSQFSKSLLIKKAQQLEPKLYDGSIIQKTNAIVIRDSEETLMLEDECRSKMLQKQKDPMMSEKKVNTKPVDYAALNQLSQDFETRFVPQTELSAEQSAENFDLNSILQEKALVITSLKDTLCKLKGNALVDEAVTLHPIDPELLRIDVALLAPKLRNNRTAHYDYLKHTQEETATLREIVENERLINTQYFLRLCVITTTAIVPLRKHIPLESNTSKSVLTLVYSRKPKESRNNVPVSKSKINKSLSANKKEPSKSWGSIISNVPSSSTVDCRLSKLFSVKFDNDHVAKIIGYGKYKTGNVTILRVYFVEGLGHNLFFVGQFCDLDLEVAFRQHTCFICNLEGVDLLIGSQGNNLYTLSLGDMMASLPICLLSKASKTKFWLWHRRLSYLNFGAINHLARQGLPKLKFKNDHLCSACVTGKSKRKSHKPKSKDTNQEKLYLLHMDLCGPMRVESVNGKKYILVIVDDYSRFT
nr:retrovirus-related Pol polyprotein from transposon TNT 1-94 [Tanacetum cinerariifolium]